MELKPEMANAWIFQSKPQQFRLNAFFSAKPKAGLWLASQDADLMQLGDIVYLWQAIGKSDRSQSGILGRGEIASEPEITADIGAGKRYWIDPKDATEITQRVLVELNQTSTSPILHRDTIDRNAVIGRLRLFTSRVGTNFRLDAEQAEELATLWSR